MDIVGDVVNSEVLQADRGRHGGNFSVRSTRSPDPAHVYVTKIEENNSRGKSRYRGSPGDIPT